MMLRVLLGVCLLATAMMADEHDVDASMFGFFSHEDRRESVAPSHECRAHQMLMRVNVRCHICLSFSQFVLLVFY